MNLSISLASKFAIVRAPRSIVFDPHLSPSPFSPAHSHAQRPPPRQRALHGGHDHSRGRRAPRCALGLEALCVAIRPTAVCRGRPAARLGLRLGLGGADPALADPPRRGPRLASTRRPRRPEAALALERQAGVHLGQRPRLHPDRAALGRRAVLDHRVVQTRGFSEFTRPEA